MASKQSKPSDRRISRVELKHWRGATCSHQIDFDASKQVVLIYGENGTGKSSILDGIEYALSGKLGSLEFLSLDGETRKEKYLATIGKPSKNAAVAVGIGSLEIKASLASQGISKDAPKVFSIRRATLKKLTESTPADRYSLIAPCFEVENVRKCEEELANVVKDYERRSNDANIRTTESLTSLRDQHQLTKPQGLITDSVVTKWATDTAARDLTSDKQKKMLLDRVIQNAPAFFMRASDVVATSATLGQAQTVRKTLDETPLLDAPSKRDQDLERVLDPGKSYLQTHRPDQCPVCERDDAVDARITRLTERLSGLASSKSVNQQRAAADTAIRSAETQLNSNLTKLQSAISALVPDLQAASDDLLSVVQGFQGVENFDTEGLTKLKVTAESKDAHIARISAKRDRIAERITLIESLGVTLKKYTHNKEQSTHYAETTKRLKESLKVVQDMRKAFIQSELDAISGEVASMYRALHPSEPYTPGAIELIEGKKGSLVHKAKIGNLDTIPNATFSESHIDTLALCVHLALAKRIGGSDCILILDDVYQSVDNQHLDRIIDLLMEESKHFRQVVMATHLLRAARRFMMNRVGKGDVDHIVLQSKWSLERGLQWRNQPLECEVLEAMVDGPDFDRQAVASKTGMLMEAVLDTLVCNYRCKVPKAADGENTLAELKNGFAKVAKTFKKQEGTLGSSGWAESGKPVALESSWRDFEDYFGIRNDVGAHWKEIGQDVPDKDVEFFARASLMILEIVTCQHCRSLPRKREGSYWSCTCKRARFTPLESV